MKEVAFCFKVNGLFTIGKKNVCTSFIYLISNIPLVKFKHPLQMNECFNFLKEKGKKNNAFANANSFR